MRAFPRANPVWTGRSLPMPQSLYRVNRSTECYIVRGRATIGLDRMGIIVTALNRLHLLGRTKRTCPSRLEAQQALDRLKKACKSEADHLRLTLKQTLVRLWAFDRIARQRIQGHQQAMVEPENHLESSGIVSQIPPNHHYSHLASEEHPQVK